MVFMVLTYILWHGISINIPKLNVIHSLRSWFNLCVQPCDVILYIFFYHLYKIWMIEGVSPNEGCMDQSPFTRISITRNYHCNVQSNTNDFSYSFFVWLGVNGKFNIDLQFSFFFLNFFL